LNTFAAQMNFSSIHRKDFVEQLASTQFDLLVIGGGITGCGIALDAALRGMKVALIEKNDFASGTSSRSTKLIHGGLRYLKQLEIKLVHDVGSERAVVHRNARHVVIPEKMLLPIVENGSLGKNSSSLGLLVYDLLAGVKKDERRKMLNKHDTLKAEPLLAKDKLVGGGLYFEYRTDDSRLTIEIAKSAFANGATLLNYAESKGFVYNSDKKITGAKVIDNISGQEFEVKASVVVNACGPWVDLLRKEDNSLKGKRLLLTKGVHLVFPYEKLPLQQAAYFDVGDGRMIFAIPRNSITYVGTTDTVYNQSIDKPQCSKEDVEYLLKAVNNIFPTLQLKQQDIVSSWAGLRPLIFEDGKSASEVSRKDEVMISDSGLISIAGGKLTGVPLNG
jgi:glycerol-3-phosphate dehydrogenase